MTAFKTKPKGKRPKRGVQIVQIKGRSGYYFRWYESRAKNILIKFTVTLPHHLKLDTAKHGGLLVLEEPPDDSCFKYFLSKGNVIKKIAGIPINTISDFESVLNEHDGNGKEIGGMISLTGKIGSIPILYKAAEKESIARAMLNSKGADQIKLDKKNKVSYIPKKEITFNALCDQYLIWAKSNKSDYSKSWIRRIEGIVKCHKTRWGHLPINKITTKLIEDWKDTRLEDKSYSTLNNELSPLRVMFKLALAGKFKQITVKENPVKSIELTRPKKEKGRIVKFLDEDELHLLLNIAKEHDEKRLLTSGHGVAGLPLEEIKKGYNLFTGTFDHARLKFLSLTGLRKMQFVDLTWKQYNSKSGVLSLRSSDEHSEKSRDFNLPLPAEAKKIIDGQPKTGKYIFPNLQGRRDVQIALRLSRGIFKKFKDHPEGKKIHLHLLRHTALTHLLKHTKNLKYVSEYAGHSSLKVTEIYAKVLPDELKTAVTDFNI